MKIFLSNLKSVVEEGDVGAEYNTTLSQSKAAYDTFLSRMFDNMVIIIQQYRKFFQTMKVIVDLIVILAFRIDEFGKRQ